MTKLQLKDFSNWQEYYWQYQFLLAEEYYVPLLARWGFSIAGKRVLDIGCGNGGFTAAFGEENAICTGVEIKQFDWRLTKNVIYKVQDILQNNAVKNLGSDFDLIILRDVIEHIPGQNKESFLKAVKGFCHKDTKILITFPPFYSPFGLHQQTFLKSFLRKMPYLGLLPNFILIPLLKVFRESEAALENIVEIKQCRMTIANFLRLSARLNFSVRNSQYFLIRPSHEIRFGWKTRRSSIGQIPVLREIFVLGTVYLLEID